MLRAMDAMVAGLRAHQNKLDVIGHNIANVNTFGFKAQSYTFKEAMYQTSTPSTGGTGSAGGVNAAQYGFGTMMGSISTDMGASTPTYTGGMNATINGEGFFITYSMIVDGGVEPEAMKETDFAYTRVGQFKMDSTGYLVDSNGNFVYGFQPEDNVRNPQDAWGENLTALRAPSAVDVDGTPTYDEKEAMQLSNVSINELGEVTGIVEMQTGTKEKPKLDANGDKIPARDDQGNPIFADDPVDPKDPNVVEATDKDGNPIYVNDDPAQGPRYQKVVTVEVPIYENVTISLGKIAIANFQNPEGLTKKGQFYYSASKSDNSGESSATIPGGGTSKLTAGYLEASNVDLAKEFAEMITTQRGFQANSKIITVSDEILNELVNMKR